jgi:anaerobic magnesium-protoporphyrin IX monomethyl ester cyclase
MKNNGFFESNRSQVKKNRKILFITPPFHAGVVEVAGSWVPLYYVYLAGATRAAGYETEIYDAMTKNVGYAEIKKKITESRPDFVAVSAITCTSPDAIKVLELAKSINPDIMTIMGGVHASFMFDEIFSLTDAVDFIIRGEGELTIVELLDAIVSDGDITNVQGIVYCHKKKTFINSQRPLMRNLDSMPMAWDLLDWDDYTYYILPGSRLGAVCTSRGCDKECTFCSQQKFWQKTWRARSPEDIVQEMMTLRYQYDVDVVLFTDDYPTPDRQRWERLLDLIIEKNMDMKILMETRAADIIRDEDILYKYKKAGIVHIYVGTEATQQESLDYIKKDLSIEESKKALSLLRFNPDFAHFLAIAPWPYADIYDDLKQYVAVRDYQKYNLIDPIIKPKAMTLEELDKAIVDCYRKFYMYRFKDMTTQESDEFKKNYMLTSMKLMMSNSFIKKKIGALGEMPEEVKRIIQTEQYTREVCPKTAAHN